MPRLSPFSPASMGQGAQGPTCDLRRPPVPMVSLDAGLDSQPQESTLGGQIGYRQRVHGRILSCIIGRFQRAWCYTHQGQAASIRASHSGSRVGRGAYRAARAAVSAHRALLIRAGARAVQ